ncbi:hypothetical protein ING2D1G_0691 [Peptoniphilus sp. ING2-D1G]|nr:hypothetical protein ING2D1G_0691 [Peptoniphilus sp. ING2-D1G]
MKYIVRKKGWYITGYSKEKDNEQQVLSKSHYDSEKVLHFTKRKEAQALATLVGGKVEEVENGH